MQGSPPECRGLSQAGGLYAPVSSPPRFIAPMPSSIDMSGVTSHFESAPPDAKASESAAAA